MKQEKAQKAAELSMELSGLYQRQAELMEELAKALLVQQVWPEAFKDGCSCKLMAREVVTTMQEANRLRKIGKTIPLQRCYIKRSDGVEFDIDTETYWRLKGKGI